MSVIISNACFAKGTYILTNKGNVLVEELRAGDKVATFSGSFVPVKWIGRRRVDLRAVSEAQAESSKPVLIPKSSLADQVPYCDLVISKCHAVLVRGLRLAGSLVNGRDIRILHDLDEITYYHVELDVFDFIVANGLATESYRDVGNRHWFDNFTEWLQQPSSRRPSGSCEGVDHLLPAPTSGIEGNARL